MCVCVSVRLPITSDGSSHAYPRQPSFFSVVVFFASFCPLPLLSFFVFFSFCIIRRHFPEVANKNVVPTASSCSRCTVCTLCATTQKGGPGSVCKTNPPRLPCTASVPFSCPRHFNHSYNTTLNTIHPSSLFSYFSLIRLLFLFLLLFPVSSTNKEERKSYHAQVNNCKLIYISSFNSSFFSSLSLSLSPTHTHMHSHHST